MPVQCTCLQCGAAFRVNPGTIKKGGGKFCKRACRTVWRVGKSSPVWPRILTRVTPGPLPERHPEYGPCLLWTGAKKSNGYGFVMSDGKDIGVHRAAWIDATGEPIPDEMVVGHTCDIKHCLQNEGEGIYVVRGVAYPRRGHLFLCPTEVNQFDKVEKGREARGDRSGRRTKPDAFPVGSQKPSAKLTEALATQIRAEYAAGGIRQVDLAAKYGMRQAAISSLLRRETWKHVP